MQNILRRESCAKRQRQALVCVCAIWQHFPLPFAAQLFHPSNHSANKQTFLVGNITAIVRMTGFLSNITFLVNARYSILHSHFMKEILPASISNKPRHAYFERKYAKHLF